MDLQAAVKKLSCVRRVHAKGEIVTGVEINHAPRPPEVL